MFHWRTDGFHLWVCAVSFALWLVWTFSIPLSDILSLLLGFVLIPLVILFLGTWAWTVVHGARRKAWLPFVIASAFAGLLMAVPWPRLYVDLNFRLMLASRMEIIRRVQADDYWENRDHIQVCRAVGAGGNHPVVFYLNRGFLHHFDALVYVPEGIPIAQVASSNCVATNPPKIRPRGPEASGWYTASN